MSERMSEGMSERMLEDMSERMSEGLSERMSKDMSEGMLEEYVRKNIEDCSCQSAKLRVTERISGDELYVYPHLTRSGWHKI